MGMTKEEKDERRREWWHRNKDRLNAYQRQWKEEHPGFRKRYRDKHKDKVAESNKKWREANPEKCKVYTLARMQRQNIEKPDNCFLCNATGVKLEGHHQDYSKPTEWTWLCTKCHRKLHAEQRNSRR